MEYSHDGEKEAEKCTEGRGGVKTLPFIMANEIFEKVAGFGLNANMIIYLTKEYHMNSATAATMLFIWGAISNFASIPGALISDCYLGRFRAVAFGSVTSLMGIVFLWLTAILPGARPSACNLASNHCKQPAPKHLALLLLAFACMSIGAGGVRPCSMAFGADQFSKHPPQKRSRIFQAYFNAYYASVGLSFMVAVTAIVYVQDKVGWKAGFAIPAVLMMLSVVTFLLGSSLYIKEKGDKNMFSGIGTAIVTVFKNRNALLPLKASEGCYYHLKGSKLSVPSDKLRFLNKACIISSTKEDQACTNIDTSGQCNRNNLCTVDQVEQLKSAIRILPIWSSTILVSLVMNQNFPVLQADAMDRRVGTHGFQIPAASFSMFGMATMTLWSGCYDRWIAPVLQKLTGTPRGLSLKQRIGGGILLATATMAVSAIVEGARRRMEVGTNAMGAVTMSALWLVPQYALVGLAEAFGVIGQIEFYYTELPKSMASFGMALFYMGMGVASLVGSLLIKVIDEVSKSGGKVSWLSSNLNKGHYDYYYWVLTGLGVVNLAYFVVCCWVYGEEGKNVVSEDEGDQELRVV